MDIFEARGPGPSVEGPGEFGSNLLLIENMADNGDY
jgi:hypothetical protein